MAIYYNKKMKMPPARKKPAKPMLGDDIFTKNKSMAMGQLCSTVLQHHPTLHQHLEAIIKEALNEPDSQNHPSCEAFFGTADSEGLISFFRQRPDFTQDERLVRALLSVRRWEVLAKTPFKLDHAAESIKNHIEVALTHGKPTTQETVDMTHLWLQLNDPVGRDWNVAATKSEERQFTLGDMLLAAAAGNIPRNINILLKAVEVKKRRLLTSSLEDMSANDSRDVGMQKKDMMFSGKNQEELMKPRAYVQNYMLFAYCLNHEANVAAFDLFKQTTPLMNDVRKIAVTDVLICHQNEMIKKAEAALHVSLPQASEAGLARAHEGMRTGFSMVKLLLEERPLLFSHIEKNFRQTDWAFLKKHEKIVPNDVFQSYSDLFPSLPNDIVPSTEGQLLPSMPATQWRLFLKTKVLLDKRMRDNIPVLSEPEVKDSIANFPLVREALQKWLKQHHPPSWQIEYE